MKPILEIATQVGTPLALGGLIAGFFFFVVLKILTPAFLPQLKPSAGFALLQQIVRAFFILSLIAMALGAVAWLAGKKLDRQESRVSIDTSTTSTPVALATNANISLTNLPSLSETHILVEQSTQVPTTNPLVVVNTGVPIPDYLNLAITHGITANAISNFFGKVYGTNVPTSQLDKELQKFATEYKELREYFLKYPQSDLAKERLKAQGLAALEEADLETARKIKGQLFWPSPVLRIVPP